jgi:3'-5' exoribonuclease
MRQYIEELKKLPDGSPARGKFAVRSKEAVRDYKNKEGKFFFLEVADRTGSLGLKYWGGSDSRTAVELYNSLQVGEVVMVTGTVGIDKFDGVPVITVNEGSNLLKRVDNVPTDELSEYLPTTKRDRAAMLAEVMDGIGGLGNEHLKALLESFFSETSFRERYSSAPSAMVHHHNYIGGNMEHSLNVLKLCMMLCDFYPELDRDLLTAGAILHDVGKLDEYSSRAAITMTDEGRFLGHVTIGGRMVAERARQVRGFPQEFLMKLGHMIMTHHGSLEEVQRRGFKIPEAAALHWADQADSQTKEFIQAVESAKETTGGWVYNRAIGNEIYTK